MVCYVHLFPDPHSVTSHWKHISHGESIFTPKINRSYKLELFPQRFNCSTFTITFTARLYATTETTCHLAINPTQPYFPLKQNNSCPFSWATGEVFDFHLGVMLFEKCLFKNIWSNSVSQNEITIEFMNKHNFLHAHKKNMLTNVVFYNKLITSKITGPVLRRKLWKQTSKYCKKALFPFSKQT